MGFLISGAKFYRRKYLDLKDTKINNLPHDFLQDILVISDKEQLLTFHVKQII